ncbi:MAG: amino acid ABC transporter substrate-binding protein, partial [Methylobacteriaceae bacterium]|nr:amino acid ABC transporter substrate-binding protein [Methylobacteriaceae bacterium]
MNRTIRALVAALGALACAGAASADTLDQVRQRGALACGVSTGLFGFSERKADGSWSGFDVDMCRAIAAAVLGDASKATFTPLSAAERFEALRQGRIDVLTRNTTWTLQREAQLGLVFAGVNFHDGQGFMARREANVASALELGGRKVCVQAGTSGVAVARDFFVENAMQVELRTLPDAPATLAAFAAGECEAMTTDNSGLFAERLKLPKPSDATILPDIISKEPLGPVTRADDMRWHMIVKWVTFALINAEELGVTAANAAEAARSAKPDVRRFVGAEGELGKMLGLSNDWALR